MLTVYLYNSHVNNFLLFLQATLPKDLKKKSGLRGGGTNKKQAIWTFLKGISFREAIGGPSDSSEG